MRQLPYSIVSALLFTWKRERLGVQRSQVERSGVAKRRGTVIQRTGRQAGKQADRQSQAGRQTARPGQRRKSVILNGQRTDIARELEIGANRERKRDIQANRV